MFDVAYDEIVIVQPQRQCRGWADAQTNPTELDSSDCCMEVQGIRPTRLHSEGIEAKCAPPFLQRPLRVARNNRVDS